MRNTVDPDFLWGGAISNVQAEGATQADGKGLDVYDKLIVRPEHGQLAQGDSNIASNHYRQFTEDIALMKQMVPEFLSRNSPSLPSEIQAVLSTYGMLLLSHAAFLSLQAMLSRP